ncbi:hypothetical protein [Diaphorobacter sp.]|uniref:hypothetical protein n=1 Tax=Diaphorobacter sp. TaxID=1934310 RepID=UPI0028ABEB33|nr:hypothetical protein [Diaphorobacter sp.]
MLTTDDPKMDFATRIALHDAVLAQLVARSMQNAPDAQSTSQRLQTFEEDLVGTMATLGRSDKLNFSLDQAVWTREQHEYGKKLAHEFARTVEGYMQPK